MRGIEMKAGIDRGGRRYWLGAALSSYARGGNKWVYGAEYLQTNHPYRNVNVPVAQFTAEGGFYYNFLSDVKKTVFVYAGASALAGYETVNWGERTLYDGARLNNRDGFVYGVRRHAGHGAVSCRLHRTDGFGQGAFPMGRQHGHVPYGVRDRYKVHHQLMYEPMETEIDRMKRIPIEDFLARLGHSPVQSAATNALWYKAPYREERTASFKVNMERNLWYDYGLGKGGNIFALAGEFIHCADFLSQVRYVAEVAGMPLPEKKVYHPCEVRRPVEPSFENVELMSLQNRALLCYMQERGISSGVAIGGCREIHYTTHGKRYFAVAFGNGGGGYEIRNRFFKGCLPPKDVTLLAYGSASCNLYEGFMDYLSARVLGIGNGEDHLVLNSVANLTKAYRHLDGYGRLQCHFDNDEAGRRTLEALRARYGGKVTDCSGLYGGCKDLNDYLQKTLAERQTWRENEKKGKNNGIKL